jgi:Na+-driven multidrug efflux pump
MLRALRRSAAAPRWDREAVPRLAAEAKALLAAAAALGVIYMSKTSAYMLLQAATVRLPPLLLAAHSPVFMMWSVATFTCTPAEQAALAFYPAARGGRARAEVARLVVLLGGCAGAALTLLAHGVPALAPGLLAAEPALWPLMQSVWLPGSLALAACGLDVSSTGILLAAGDRAYVARAMLISLAGLAGALAWTTANIGGLLAIWWTLAAFFAIRVAQSLPRAARYMRHAPAAKLA